jgi:glycosyltransferase involved in cell wall biosynthesis
MKILLITGIYPPDIGGPATYIPRFAKFLSQQNHEVTTIALKPPGQKAGEIADWEEHFIPRHKNKLLRFAHAVMVIMKYGRKSDYIYSNGLFIETSIANLFLRKNSTAKIVGDPVWERFINRTGSKVTLKEFTENEIPLLQRFQRKTYNWAFSRFTNLTTPGYELSRMIGIWGNHLTARVIANGTECRQYGNKKREIDVLSVSRLVQWKNVDILLEACSGLGLKVVIVGDGPDRRKLENLSFNLNLDTDFVGQVSRSQVGEFMSNSKIFVLLSDYEGLSIALVEAMMSGCRPLVSNIEANKSVVVNDRVGTVIDHHNSIEVKRAISKLIGDSIENINISKRAHEEAVRNYCEENQLIKMQELLMS